MPRTKEYKPKDALEKAMELFWQKGYFDTSMDDLVEFTGVSRYGLYSTFGDKHDLFIAALKYYREETVSALLHSMDAADASLAQIRSYFSSLMLTGNATGRRGCLICNTAVEVAPFDRDAAEQVDTSFKQMNKAFRNALTNACQRGELSSRFDVDAGADYLTGVAQGLFVLARSPASGKSIRHFVQTALDVLE
jgi:TetR/AcrR family transcriptional regulator, transcriptional repressor for nem operon